ncbi:translocation/assembly module TamB domain-containing protein [Algoriphagus namhaensis]
MEKNSKVTDFLYKALRVVLRLVFFLLLFFIFFALALQITAVQNFLIDRTTAYLNRKGDFHTEIGQIRLTWWDVLQLEDVRITDHRDSLMLSAKKLTADFELFSILPPGDINIDLVRVENAKIQLITHAGDSSININRWIKELQGLFGASQSSGTSPGFGMDLIEIRQTEFALLNFNRDTIPEGLDYNHMRFGEITANANTFLFKDSQLSLDIDMLSGTEIASGLRIEEFQSEMRYSAKELVFERLNLKSENSQIRDYLRFQYDSVAAFSDFINQVKLTINMEETVLDLEDLLLFAPTLPDIEDKITLTGRISGTVSDFKSEQFLLRLGQKTEVFGALELDGLPDFEETYVNLSLQNSTIFAKDLSPYLSDSLALVVDKFREIRLSADFAGLRRRFDTNGDFKTAIGDISGRVRFDTQDGLPTIASNVKIKNLDLGVLTANPELFQKISLDGRVDLKGNSAENILIGMDAKISKVGLNRYDYTNIQTDAQYGVNLFRGNLTINDPNIRVKASGTVNLAESIDSIRMQIEVDSAMLDRINLTEKEAFISGKIELDTKGITLDDLQGIGRFQDITAGFEGRSLEVGDFFFQSLFAGGTRTISINSDYLVAAASGQFNLEQMRRDLPILFEQYISIILNEEQPIADLNQNFSENYSADLNIKLLDVNPIIQLFEPDLYLSPNTILEGAFYQTPENTVFNFFTSIDELAYKNYSAQDINVDFNTSKIINSEDILASFYVYSKSQSVSRDLNFTNLGLEAIWDQNQMNLDFSLDQDSTQSSARINAIARFSSESTTFNFSPSKLQVLNKNWEFDPKNEIRIRPESIEVENLKIFNQDQFVALEGRVSENPEDRLNLAIQQVDISILNTLTVQNFSGIADGLITLERGFEGRQYEGNLGIKGLEINAFPIGDIIGTAQMEGERLLVSLENVKGNKKTFDLDGSMGLAEKDLAIQVKLNETNLVTLEPFLSKYISELNGTTSGNLDISGTLDAPVILGKAELDQGKMVINYLQTSYQIDGEILFEEDEISFQELEIRDRFRNLATFRGGITHQNFKNFYLNISSNLRNFEVLNTGSEDNQSFYGEAYVTGTLELKGSTTNLDINARATSNPNTRIFIPIGSDNSQAQEDFITFINIRDTVRVQAVQEVEDRLDIQNIRMNFVLDITPDALAEIIIDPRTNEGIQGRGRGVLTLNIDTQGNFLLNGTYEITEGLYNFSLYNVVNKQFNIRPGGKITWFGDPYEGIMDISAEYVERVSLQPILAASTVDDQSSQNTRRYPVKVIMDLRGELLSPDIDFGFDFSEFPSSGDFQTTIAAFQNRIANDEQEMNRQVFSVILTKSLSPEGQFSGVANISSSLGQLLSSQLNTFLGQVDKNLEVDLDVNSLDQNTLETFQLSVAYTFLDGRLRISRDGGFTDNQGNADATSIIGDWQAEYTLTEDGVYRIRIFNKNNFNTFTSLSLSQNVATYGVAMSQNVSFNSFGELFKKITRKKEERLRINDNDDFLRYQNGEEWRPIDLDRLDERYDSLQNVIKNIPPESDN